MDAGFGNLGYVITPAWAEKNELVCVGRSGDLRLTILVWSAKAAEADDEQARDGLRVLQKKWGYKIESTVDGPITCAQRFAPWSDLTAWRRDGMYCFEVRGDRRVSIAVKPRMPMTKAPVPVENLRTLVAKAASRL